VDPNVANDDLARLEAHLDGALPADEAEALCRRLDDEPALAEALQRLRAEREVRRAVWASYEPGDDDADATASDVLAAAAREQRWRSISRVFRRVGAVAAAVVVAFSCGWVARGRVPSRPAPHQRHAVVEEEQRFVSAGSGDATSFPVALTDENGEIIAVQQFDNAADARRFADDVRRWQSRPRRDRAVPMSGEF
jgi:anti-sigma factor RsiW